MFIEISVLPQLLSNLLPYLATSDSLQHSFGTRAEIWAGRLTCQQLWVKCFPEADLPLQDWGKKSYSACFFPPVLCPPLPPEGLRNSSTLKSLKGRPEVGLETLISRYIEQKNITPTAAILFPKGRSCPISREKDIKVEDFGGGTSPTSPTTKHSLPSALST